MGTAAPKLEARLQAEGIQVTHLSVPPGSGVEQRSFLAERYNQLLSDLPLILPWQHPDTHSSCHLYVIRLKLDQINKTHRQVFEELRSLGIGVNLHYNSCTYAALLPRVGFCLG